MAKEFIHVDGRKICAEDNCCLREDAKHFEELAHPQRDQLFLVSPTLTRKGRVALCKHDEYCTTSTCALQHPRREARKKTSDRRPFCSHDEFCTNQTQQHRVQYQHPRFDVKNRERIEEEGGGVEEKEEPKKKVATPPQTYLSPVGVMPNGYMPVTQGYVMTPQGYGYMPITQGYSGYNSQGYMAGGGYMVNAPGCSPSPPPGFGTTCYGSPSFSYQPFGTASPPPSFGTTSYSPSFGTTSYPPSFQQTTTTLPPLPPLPPKKKLLLTGVITGNQSTIKAKRQFELEEDKGQARCFNDMCCYCARPGNRATVGEGHTRLDCSNCMVSFMIDPTSGLWKEVEYETTTP